MQQDAIRGGTAVAHRNLAAFGPEALPSDVETLVEQARIALGNDNATTRRCLDQIALLLRHPPARVAMPARPDAPVRGGLACWQLRLIVRHIEANLASNIPIGSLSEIARLSNGHFCRAFKISTGDTPHTFITRKRIARAQRMMVTTSDSLSQIACACGLTDQAHLTRLFRKFVGETPLVWRRTWQRT